MTNISRETALAKYGESIVAATVKAARELAVLETIKAYPTAKDLMAREDGRDYTYTATFNDGEALECRACLPLSKYVKSSTDRKVLNVFAARVAEAVADYEKATDEHAAAAAIDRMTLFANKYAAMYGVQDVAMFGRRDKKLIIAGVAGVKTVAKGTANVNLASNGGISKLLDGLLTNKVRNYAAKIMQGKTSYMTLEEAEANKAALAAEKAKRLAEAAREAQERAEAEKEAARAAIEQENAAIREAKEQEAKEEAEAAKKEAEKAAKREAANARRREKREAEKAEKAAKEEATQDETAAA